MKIYGDDQLLWLGTVTAQNSGAARIDISGVTQTLRIEVDGASADGTTVVLGDARLLS